MNDWLKGGLIGVLSYILLLAICFVGMFAFSFMGEGNIFAWLLLLLALPGAAILSPFWIGPALENGGPILSFIITAVMFFIIGGSLKFFIGKKESSK